MSQPASDPNNISEAKQSTTSSDSNRVPPLSSDYAPYPKLDPKDVAPPPENWTNVSMGSQSQPNQGPATFSGSAATTMPAESNPYVSPAPVRSSSGTKVLAEGGYDKIFRTTFETAPEEQLLKTYACYLSTSAGPVMGVLYLSSQKLAFCSDNPLSYQVGAQTQWSYYKVAIPLHQLRAVNPSTSKANPAEKYIQIISVDNHEFWFMGFVHYDSAVKNLQRPLQPARSS
ncbi:hypothetical protein GOBAR_DD12884 [Gossypium barbadense]|nr:hypothetical protein GOBAR_DD12884 [Gossypium barbadense]